MGEKGGGVGGEQTKEFRRGLGRGGGADVKGLNAHNDITHHHTSHSPNFGSSGLLCEKNNSTKTQCV